VLRPHDLRILKAGEDGIVRGSKAYDGRIPDGGIVSLGQRVAEIRFDELFEVGDDLGVGQIGLEARFSLIGLDRIRDIEFRVNLDGDVLPSGLAFWVGLARATLDRWLVERLAESWRGSLGDVVGGSNPQLLVALLQQFLGEIIRGLSLGKLGGSLLGEDLTFDEVVNLVSQRRGGIAQDGRTILDLHREHLARIGMIAAVVDLENVVGQGRLERLSLELVGIRLAPMGHFSPVDWLVDFGYFWHL
jgi:hypothetical protein